MLTISILFQLLSNAVTLRRDKSILYSRTSINILLYCIYSIYFMRKTVKAIGLFGGLFHATSITKIFHIFFYIISAIILQLTAYYPRKLLAGIGKSRIKIKVSNIYRSYLINKLTEQFKILEYSLIILFIISGAILLMSSTDLISMFLSIELQSYGLYILSTIYKNSEHSTKAGLTYFLLGGLSSCFILLGTSLLYSNTATTNLEGIYVISSLTGYTNLGNKNFFYEPSYINISLIIMAVGFLFKVSAAPFHFWSPDVYDAIPTVVTTFVAIVAKISIFIFLLELLQHTAPQAKNIFASSSVVDSIESQSYLCEAQLNGYEFNWINSLLISCLLSLIIGTVLGLTQNRIKRLFAYSTISHVGFILLALSINSIESIQAFLFYLMQYSLTNLNAFFILIAIGYSYCVNIALIEGKAKLSRKLGLNYVVPPSYELLDKSNSPIQFIKQIKGLFYLNPILTLSLTITIFSFVGIPPLIGFFAKQMVLSAALDSGYYFLALIAILTSVISAVYYLNIIKEIYFFPHTYFGSTGLNKDEKDNGLGNITAKLPGYLTSFNLDNPYYSQSEKNLCSNDTSRLVLSNYLTITISVLTLGVLLFIFVPKQWLSMANILALNLFNT